MIDKNDAYMWVTSMRNFFNFIRRTWMLFLLLFTAPVIVIVLFAIKEYVFHSIDLSAGEWANLMGCAFSYWGTILLGTLAFWQNDRIMQLEERNAEIQEIELKMKSVPDFIIDKILLSFGKFEEKELELESIYRSGYKETYQSEVDINEDISILFLYIVLKNSSNASAHNVEVYESVLDKNLKNHLFIMGSYVHKSIEKQDSICLCYYIHFDEIKPQNGVKFTEYRFNLNYENIYQHHFYNHMIIFAGIMDNKILIQAAIGEQHNEKKDLEPRNMVNDIK